MFYFSTGFHRNNWPNWVSYDHRTGRCKFSGSVALGAFVGPVKPIHWNKTNQFIMKICLTITQVRVFSASPTDYFPNIDYILMHVEVVHFSIQGVNALLNVSPSLSLHHLMPFILMRVSGFMSAFNWPWIAIWSLISWEVCIPGYRTFGLNKQKTDCLHLMELGVMNCAHHNICLHSGSVLCLSLL